MIIEQVIRQAINDSVKSNEIIKCEIDGTYTDLQNAVTATHTGEWDANDELDGSTDCYSLGGDEWRIRVSYNTLLFVLPPKE